MATVREFIESSYRLIQEVGEGLSMSAEQAKDGLEVLVDLLETLSLEPSLVGTVSDESFTLSAGVSSYTIGVGGVFNTSQPVRIEEASIKDGDLLLSDLDIIGVDDFARIQSTDGGIPCAMWFNRGITSGTITLDAPPSQAYTLRLFSKKPLATYTSLSDTISFALGYKMPIRFLLARALAPEYGKELSQDAQRQARRAMRAIRSINASGNMGTLSCDDALIGSINYDIRTGR